MTKREFSSLSPFEKGYACYIYGKREDEPNVPEAVLYRNATMRRQYEKGQQRAVIVAQDDP